MHGGVDALSLDAIAATPFPDSTASPVPTSLDHDTESIDPFFNLIPPKPQLHQPGGMQATHFSGVCDQDGHSQAPMDGSMASIQVCNAGLSDNFSLLLPNHHSQNRARVQLAVIIISFI